MGVARNNVIYNAAAAASRCSRATAPASGGNLIVNNTIYNPTGTRAGHPGRRRANNNIIFNNILFARCRTAWRSRP